MAIETHVIVVGNEKGGSGKSTVAMHIVVALLKSGYRVGVLDLDFRQRSLTRYLANRERFADYTGMAVAMPQVGQLEPSEEDSRERAQALETEAFRTVLVTFADCHFVVIDCPGANTHLSRLAHVHADTILTPMNDSFVDFDVLGRLDAESGRITEPSLYAEIVWEARKHRALSGVQKGIDWVVIRNRLSATRANNQKEVGKKLDDLAERIGFRLARGMGERVIYRELFPAGLTLLDLGAEAAPLKLKTMSHLTARLEIRSLVAMLKLPSFKTGAGAPETIPANAAA